MANNKGGESQNRLFTPTKLLLIAIAIIVLQFPPGAFKTMVAPVFNDLAIYLTEDIAWISLVGTVPSLFMVLGNFISGSLANKVDQKVLCLIGLGLFFVGGIGPIWCESLITILAWRAVLGLGVGMSRVFGMSWVPVFFEGRQRDLVMGFLNAFGGLSSSVASILGGYLGTISWQAAFWGYTSVVIVALLVILIIPEPRRVIEKKAALAAESGEVDPSAAGEADAGPAEKAKGIDPVAIHYGLILFIEYCCIILMYSIASSFVAETGMGTSVEAGFAISVAGAVMAVVALCFAPITAVLKRWGIPIAMAVGAVGYFVMAGSSSLIVLYIAFGIVGAGMGFSNPTIFNYVAIDCKKNNAMANAIVLSGLTLGQFCSTFALAFMSSMFGTNYHAMMVLAAILLLLNGLYAFFVVRWQNKKHKA